MWGPSDLQAQAPNSTQAVGLNLDVVCPALRTEQDCVAKCARPIPTEASASVARPAWRCGVDRISCGRTCTFCCQTAKCYGNTMAAEQAARWPAAFARLHRTETGLYAHTHVVAASRGTHSWDGRCGTATTAAPGLDPPASTSAPDSQGCQSFVASVTCAQAGQIIEAAMRKHRKACRCDRC